MCRTFVAGMGGRAMSACFRNGPVIDSPHIRPRYWHAVASRLALVLLAATPLRGEAADPALWDMSLEELAATRITVASRVSENADLAPSSVTVFKPSDFSALGARYVDDVLRYVPGMTVARSPERGSMVDSISVRGRRSSHDSPDVLFMLDGQRLNNEYSGSISPFIRHISLANVRQIEVIRGPGSALYGSNAFVAVVNIVTDPARRESFVGVGNHGNGTASITQQWQGDDRALSVFAQGDYREGEAFRLSDGLRSADTTRDAERGGQFYARYEQGDFQLNGRYAAFREEDFILNRFIDDDVNEVDAEHALLNARYQFLKEEGRELVASLSYQYGWDRLLLGLPANSLRTGPAYTLVPFPVEVGAKIGVQETGAAVDGVYQLGEHRLAGGVALRQHLDRQSDRIANYGPEDASNLGSVQVVGDQLLNHDGRQVASAYLEDHLNLTQDWSATVGGRFDDYEEIGGSFNQRAALIWQVTGQHILKAQYGTAFRAPTRFEMAGSSDNSLQGNPQLEPERVETSELAWIVAGDQLHSGLTLFHNQIRDPIARAALPNGQQISFNDQPASFTGLEWEWRWQVAEGWSAFGAWTWVPGQDEDARSAASRFGHVGLTYGIGHWSISGNVRYHGAVDGPTGETLEAYSLLNLSLQREWGGGDSTYLHLSNLLNEHYQTYTGVYNPSNNALADGIPGSGLGVLLGWKHQFE